MQREKKNNHQPEDWKKQAKKELTRMEKMLQDVYVRMVLLESQIEHHQK